MESDYMSRKLTKEQEAIWDRLKHGIPKPLNVEEQIVMIMAKQISDEIDRQVLETLLNTATHHK